MAEVTTKKRKRTGKQREEAKKAAIAKAAAEAGGVAEPEAEAVIEAEAGAEAVAPEAEDAEPAPAVEGEATETPAVTEEAKPSVDFEKLTKRIPTALKKLHQLFKHAKREESQRLIKKIKFLTKKGDAVEELDTQLKLLGALDLHALSANHLKLKLRKHYLLKREGLPAETEAAIGGGHTVKASGSSATPDVIAKVENRLCSAKNVAEGVKGIVAWCLAEPGSSLNLDKMKGKKGKNAKPESDSESDDDASEGDDEREEPAAAAAAELDSDDEVVVQEKAADAAGWESGDLEGEGSDEEDSDDESGEGEDGWESGSVGGEEGGEDAWIASASDSDDAPDYAALAKLKGATGSDFESGSEAGSDSGSESSGSSIAVERPPTKKVKAEPKKAAEKPGKAEKKGEKKAAKPAIKADGSSMFLPSLAAGFTAGDDSDSDPDMDYDPDGVIGTKAAPRKNRRGQRARQAIWEKKYGKGAKHIVKQREEERKAAKKDNAGAQRSGGFVPPSRDSGYKSYRAAPESAPVLAKPGGTFGSRAPARNPAASSGGATASAGAGASAGASAGAGAGGGDEKKGTNHPSWEAARRRKEAEQKLKDAPKATKIVFD